MIKEILQSEIPFINSQECKTLGIIFHLSYRYLAFYINDAIVGVVGFKISKNTAYLGGAFVEPKYRLQSIFKQLNTERFKYLAGKTVTANCTQNSLHLHLKNGAIIIKHYKNGITKIAYGTNL
jgi:hypothetical protein